MAAVTGDPAPKRVTLGFEGGLTVTRRLTPAHIEGLKAAVESDAQWHELRTEQELIMISLSRLAYFELDETGRRIGFD